MRVWLRWKKNREATEVTKTIQLCAAVQSAWLLCLCIFSLRSRCCSGLFSFVKRCQTCNCNQKCWYYANTHLLQSQCVCYGAFFSIEPRDKLHEHVVFVVFYLFSSLCFIRYSRHSDGCFGFNTHSVVCECVCISSFGGFLLLAYYLKRPYSNNGMINDRFYSFIHESELGHD